MVWHGNKLTSDSSVPFYRTALRNERSMHPAMNLIVNSSQKKVILSSHWKCNEETY